ncbi:uncharacterized protein Bfra_007901 [Botrytis fragariae]|uniref:Uncharacterized protein n=1 Tax=Botrytis fragariae TaxID=1964551 RepID=A0A8H6APV8_9HELO|nr:uncharacterized protein Bfra_007901 [Botrytis fragariae]KAF5871386.1 hypothetical protein Bfra_007901 [Botrytis fragariae]
MHLGPTSTCRSNPLNVLPCNLISFLHTQPVTHRHIYDFPTSILTKMFGDADPLFSQDWTY